MYQGALEYTGTITDVSDERLKENIQPINGALQKIQGINGVSYNMIDTPEQIEIGVIAQNVQEVLPEAVKVVDEENGYLGVSYTSLIPVLIEAVKEQQSQIEQLTVENETVKAENEQLKEKLLALAARQDAIEAVVLGGANNEDERLAKLNDKLKMVK